MFRSDLKSANVFLSNKNMIKIGDLGVAKLLAATRYAHTPPALSLPRCFLPLLRHETAETD